MTATRKLQAEIDRCLKKVAEGVDKFDDTWNKVHHASNSNQKEKYEEDLKKEIKKLQRLRDQIKTWIASAEIKDKSVLVEKRKLIEAKMEKFKIVERETKTKAYSKEGLTSGQKLDPAERERCEISQWLNKCLEDINIQIDQFEAEIEAFGTSKKKKGRNNDNDQIEELNQLLEKHRDHVQKLETLLRMLDNDTVEIHQIKDIKDDLEYYIENCRDPDFMENDMLYEDIDGLEEMLLDGDHVHNANSVEASETMSTNSASSPIPSYMHNHSNDAGTNDINEKRRHKSSSEDSKVGSQQPPSTTPAVKTVNQQSSVSSIAAPSAVIAPQQIAPQTAASQLLQQQSNKIAGGAPAGSALGSIGSAFAPTTPVNQVSSSNPLTGSVTSLNLSGISNNALSSNVNQKGQGQGSALPLNSVNNVPPSPIASVPPVQGPGGTQPQLVATPPPAQTGSGLPGSNPGVPPALATQASSTPIKAAFNTMVANPNNSSPSSGVAAMNGSSSVIAPPSTSPLASAVTLATVLPSISAGSGTPASTGVQATGAAVPPVQTPLQHLSQAASSVPSEGRSMTGSAGVPAGPAGPAPGFSQATSAQLQPQSQTPRQEQQQQQNFAAAVQQLNGHASSLNEGRSVPSPSPSLPGSIGKQLPTSQSSSHFSGQAPSIPASSSNDTDGMPTLKSIAQEATNRAGLKVPSSHANQQTQMQSIGTTAPTISQSGLFPTPGSKDRSQKTEAHIPPLMGVAPLGPVPLNKDTQLQYAMLESAFLHMPHPSDSERLRPYLPRNPCLTPSYYPQLPPTGSDEIDFFLRLSTETLFFIFYYMEGTKAQYLAAKALKRQSWRFHTKYLMWFQRHEEPKIINDEYEQGTYVYFDFEKWGQRKKEGFTFEYRFLEDRDLD